MNNILVTGATGQLGTSAINALLQKGIDPNQIFALVRDESKADSLKTKGVQISVGEYDQFDSLVTAFKGMDKLFFVSGSEIPKRLTQHENVIKAAKEAGVGHIVYSSFTRKNESETSPLWMLNQSHLQTEKWLKESGMAYTILKNGLYADSIPMFIGGKVLETETVYFPAGNGKMSVATRQEMAEAAATVLTTAGHENKVYDTTNTEAYAYTDVATYIAEATGKEVKYVSPTLEEYKQVLGKAGVPEMYIGMFAGFALATAQDDLATVSNDLQNLIGRKPTSLKDFLKTVYPSKN